MPIVSSSPPLRPPLPARPSQSAPPAPPRSGNHALSVALIALIVMNMLAFVLLLQSSNRINALEGRVVELTDSLIQSEGRATQLIESQALKEAQARSQLANQTQENFAKLQDYITQKTSTLQLDLQNQISSASTASAASASRHDFSAIAGDALKSVVTVRTDYALGSGFFISTDGYVMTNRHVVESAGQVAVVDNDGNAHSATLVGVAREADLAVLKVNGTFPALEFASSVKVGQPVIALGTPLGLSATVTEGIVSAIDRQIDQSGVAYLQTDVAINRGNSGGPLLNSEGKVVGVNTLGLARSTGLGFAIPASVAKEIADEAMKTP